MTAGALLAAAATGAFVVSVLWLVARPRPRLAERVRPYAIGAMTALGVPVDARSVRIATGVSGDPGTGLRGAVRRLAMVVAPRAGEPLRRRLAQAGRRSGPVEQAVTDHRAAQLLWATGGAVAGGVVAGAGGMALPPGAAVVALAGAWGWSRPARGLDRTISARRDRLRAELPPVAQLLALRVRAGGSVVSAVAATAQRCHGELADELRDALAQHRAGRPLEEALDAVAALSPEPEAARLHRLLAGALRHGLDAAPELLRLARQGRERHLTRLRRDATKRRAALLLPTIGLLAPLMMVFVAAPLPSLLGA